MIAGNNRGKTKGISGSAVAAFSIKDCALVTVATGRKTRFLQEFRNRLMDIEAASIYHHFWGGLLQPRFEEREYNNDFAAWVRHAVHDLVLAERLAVLDPTAFADLDALRSKIVELIDDRLDEADQLAGARAQWPFVFIRSEIVVFDTGRRLARPQELATGVAEFSTSSIFYHFIDARRRTDDGRDDFSDWLEAFGDTYSALCKQLAGIDPFFGGLSDLRARLVRLFATELAAP